VPTRRRFHRSNKALTHRAMNAVRATRPTVTPSFRHDKPPEEITFHAHSGVCRYCTDERGRKGIVKMRRDDTTLKLMLDNCICLYCGQRYFVTLPKGMTLLQFDQQQWFEKNKEREDA
jgi:hypothetical protein